MSWNGANNVVTVTMQSAHNINLAANPKIQLAVDPSWTTDPNGIVTVTSGDAKTFTYLGPSQKPSSYTPDSGTWNYPLEYGIIPLTTSSSIIANALDGAQASGASINFYSPEQIFGWYAFSHNIAWATRGPYGWRPGPVDSNDHHGHNAGWQYKQCGIA